MKAFINEDLCIGCSLCRSICPAIFVMENEKAKVRMWDIEPIYQDDVKNARQSCPSGAIITE